MNILQQLATRIRDQFNALRALVLLAITTAIDALRAEIIDPATGKLKTSLVPALSIVDVFTVNSEAEMLGLNATLPVDGKLERGDHVIVLDAVNGDKTFILQGIDPAVIGSFVEIKNPLGAQFGTYSDFLTAFETGLN